MLAPDSRSMLLELLEPPAGFELDAAACLTYSLDLKALLTLPTAFALRGGAARLEVQDGELTPLEVLDALRSYAGRITVCCDGSGISLPHGTKLGVFGFLEKTIVPMKAPRGGVFHPKVWAVRFANPRGEHMHRLLVSSRNLTFDRSWDVIVRLEQEPGTEALPGVSRLLTACTERSMVVGTLPELHADRLRSLAQTVGQARFAPPTGFTSMRAHPLGVSADSKSPWPFPGSAKRGLVVSPYLKATMLERFPSPWARTIVVSGADEFDREFDREFDNQLDTHASQASQDDTAELTSGFFTLNPSAIDESSQEILSGLHAKVFALDVTGGDSHVFAGSANATTAAFDTNVELLLEMKGRTTSVGVRTFANQEGMRPLLLEHIFDDSEADPDPVQEHLSDLKRVLGGIAVECHVTSLENGSYDLHYVSSLPLPAAGEARIDVRPLTVASWSFAAPEQALDFSVTVDEAGITGFLALRLREGAQESTMLLSVPLIGAPEGREQRLMARLLADPARLIQFLMMLLLDGTHDRFDAAARDALDASSRASRGTLHTVPLLEVMARSLLGPRARLAEVDRLLWELESTSDLVDEDLRALWSSMRRAAGLGEETP